MVAAVVKLSENGELWPEVLDVMVAPLVESYGNGILCDVVVAAVVKM